jgi:uncharacterized protein YndB with AHSA1/START domain
MNDTATATRALVIEREISHPPARIWRALTDSTLIGQWLMSNDFKPVLGHRFNFRAPAQAGWNGVTDCRVLSIEPERQLAYSWDSSGEEAAGGLKTVVTFTLTPTARGTLLRLEHSGFRADQERNYQGANYGWQRFLGNLERVACGLN